MRATRFRPALVALTLVLAACSGSEPAASDETSNSTEIPPLSLGELPEAVAAVVEAVGADPEFTEINIQPGLINLFVAVGSDDELAYVWQSGQLADPGEPTQRIEGAVPFSLEGVDLEIVDTFDDVIAAELPDTELSVMTLSAAVVGNRPSWAATMLSERGGGLDVLLSTDGQILGAAPR